MYTNFPSRQLPKLIQRIRHPECCIAIAKRARFSIWQARYFHFSSSSSSSTPPPAGSKKENNAAGNNNPPSLKEQLSSIPNRITLLRMASTPILAYWIIYDYPTLALAGCAIAGASDFADGYLAKKYNMTTTLGTYLDPLADKVVINVLALSCWTTAILPTPLVLLWATKDILLIAGTGVYLQQQEKSMNFLRTSVTQTPLQVQPSLLGKANTALQFACLGVAIVQPLQTTPELLMGLCWITGATTVGSTLSYAFSKTAFARILSSQDKK